jgi:hypothetical protein
VLRITRFRTAAEVLLHFRAMLGTASLPICAGVLVGLILAQSAASHPHHDKTATEPKTYEFVNGQWFDGEHFLPTTFYSVNGKLTNEKPPLVDEKIDLAGGFVVPPFGEGHNHNVVQPEHLEEKIAQYLTDGIYYVKITNSIREYTDKIRAKLNLPQSLDVTFANGGLTASGGHPVKLYEEVLRKHMYGGVEKFWFNNRAYFIIDSEDDLRSKWPLILAARPDFIKTFLFYSEEFEKRRDDPAYTGRRGLDPRLLTAIVARAHQDKLRVTVHIETAADFHNALQSGVDEIAHLPGYNIPTHHPMSAFEISEEDALLAGRRGVFVVTTTILTEAKIKDLAQRQKIHKNQVRNLRLLHRHGVPIAIGSDGFEMTAAAEARHLHDLQAFDNLTLLKLWCETTPRAIFPDRKIGRLKEGYEASFLVLGGNPVADFANVGNIRRRFKQGMPLVLGSDHASVP